jgi:argininosuccinate lyase
MATLATTLSGVAEDLVVYAGRDYLEISDDYASTSSIMPQKKNPDSLEIVRARTGNATGSLQGLLTTLKGLPRSYNIDLQEATPHAWTAVDEVPAALDVAVGAVTTATWNEDVLAEEAGAGFSTATGVADLLAMAGLPFRTAHEVVAMAAQTIEQTGENPDYETIEAAAADVLDEPLDSYVDRAAVEDALDPAQSVAMRDSTGGPAPEAVEESLADARGRLDEDCDAVDARQEALDAAEQRLESEVSSYH